MPAASSESEPRQGTLSVTEQQQQQQQQQADTRQSKKGSINKHNNNNNNNNNAVDENSHSRSVSYILLALGSIINLSSISNVKRNESDFDGNLGMGVAFGAVTFGTSLLILILNGLSSSSSSFSLDYTKAAEGKLEGATLLFFTLWWTVGVGYLTQVRGIAYVVLNVYASSWITWGLCIYTLNQWSAAKDILTIEQITGISETLPSWYVLALSSTVAMGSSIDFWLKTTSVYSDDAVFAFCMSAFTTILSWGWILTHMNFLECCQEGGWMEAASAWLSILVWIVNCAVLTRDGGIGATIVGTQYRWSSTTDKALRLYYPFEEAAKDASLLTNCTFAWNVVMNNDDSIDVNGNNNMIPTMTNDSVPVSCPVDQGIPGSNLYMAAWISLAASINIALRWNAQRALELAQSTRRDAIRSASSNSSNNGGPQEQSRRSASLNSNSGVSRTRNGGSIHHDDDEGDDLENFMDADAY